MGALAWLQNLGFAGSGAGAPTFQACWADDEYTLLFGMKKNVASQVIGVQMITAADGSAFTGTTTVVITGDGGTQGASGGTGPTHEGGGCFTYVPTQAETNYSHICFTFSGTGAISKTVQVYTTFPQTGDAYATATNIETDTQDIQARLPAALVSGRIDSSVGAMATDVLTNTALAASAVTEMQSGLATQASVDTVDTVVDAIKAKTDSLTFTQAGHVDANIQRINDVAIVGDGSGTPFNV